ncbi:MAG TPA: hypothetical protein H9672_06410 [Firmicutes bacterium]|nr:hypothetical protein [Bacillota bacterium]
MGMLGLRLEHVGINAGNEQEAGKTAEAFQRLLGLETGRSGDSSVFAGNCVEVMKQKKRGRCGHLGFSTPCLERTVRYLKEMGAVFCEDPAADRSDGSLPVLYFEEEIGGFAIHLAQASS